MRANSKTVEVAYSVISNEELFKGLRKALKEEGRLVATVIGYLVEIEDRRVHLEMGSPSMFDFCLRRLGLSENEAYLRLTAARLARRHPSIVSALEARRVTLSSVVLLKDLFTEENVDELLMVASGKTKSQVQALVAQRAPKPDIPSSIRKQPPRVMAAEPILQPDLFPAAEARGPEVACAALPCVTERGARGSDRAIAPLSPERHFVRFTAPTSLREKLERAQGLMRHRNANGDLAVIVERAMDLLLASLEKERLGALTRSSAGAKRTPTSVRRPHRPKCSPKPKRAPNESAPSTSQVHADGAGGVSVVAAADAHANIGGAVGAGPSAVAATITALVVSGTGALGDTRASVRVVGRAQSEQGHAARAEVKSIARAEAKATPRPGAITRATRREVFLRDGEQCSFVSDDGERCPAKDWLELDHRTPRAKGGDGSAENIRVLCRAHNQLAAEKAFGRAQVAERIRLQQERCGAVPPAASATGPAAPKTSASERTLPLF